MSWKVTTLDSNPYVESCLSGNVSKHDLLAAHDEAIAKARASRSKLVLIDCSGLQGGHTCFDTFCLVVARHEKHESTFRKEAIVLPTLLSAVQIAKYWATVAVNRGFNVRTFADRPSASAWLTEGELSASPK